MLENLISYKCIQEPNDWFADIMKSWGLTNDDDDNEFIQAQLKMSRQNSETSLRIANKQV